MEPSAIAGWAMARYIAAGVAGGCLHQPSVPISPLEPVPRGAQPAKRSDARHVEPVTFKEMEATAVAAAPSVVPVDRPLAPRLILPTAARAGPPTAKQRAPRSQQQRTGKASRRRCRLVLEDSDVSDGMVYDEPSSESAGPSSETEPLSEADPEEPFVEQEIDVMPGCSKCHFSKNGCAMCRKTPLVTRPKIRWDPENARAQEGVPMAPTYYPDQEEFQDPIAYIAKIKQEAVKFGICRIVPPAGWNPPFALEKGTNGRSCDSFRFFSRKQFTSHLCMRAARSFNPNEAQAGHGEGRRMGGSASANPSAVSAAPPAGAVAAAHGIAGTAPDTVKVEVLHSSGGGGASHMGEHGSRSSGRMASSGPRPGSTAPGNKVRRQDTVEACAESEDMDSDEREAAARAAAEGEDEEEDDGEFGFLSSERMHTLRSFEAYAHWAKALHFGLIDAQKAAQQQQRRGSSGGDGTASFKGQKRKGPPQPSGEVRRSTATGKRKVAKGSAGQVGAKQQGTLSDRLGREPTLEEMESEFWRIVERPAPGHIAETLYGSDLDSGRHGSGFPLPFWRGIPTDARTGRYLKMNEAAALYSRHPWNVNNLPRCAKSMLRYIKCDELVTGVMAPWLYVGSCLSAFCWHVEDHAFYSINYLHLGAPKLWYGVPPSAAAAFDEAAVDALPHLFREDPLLLHRLVTMLSPSELRARGVPVYRLVHEAGSFVITFPNSYHSGFNTGFNCAEAVNFAPPDWLPHGTDVVRKYRQQGKRLTLSHDQLLLTLVRAAKATKRGQLLRQATEALKQAEELKTQAEMAAASPVPPEALAPATASAPDTAAKRAARRSRLSSGEPDISSAAAAASIATAAAAEAATAAAEAAALAAAAHSTELMSSDDDEEGVQDVVEKHDQDDGGAGVSGKDAEAEEAVRQERANSGRMAASRMEGGGQHRGCNKQHRCKDWMAMWGDGITLEDIPQEAVLYAAGELAVRLDDERLRQAAAQAFGVLQESRMVGELAARGADGMHTNTNDTDCEVCKCDLFLSAVVSRDAPGRAVCPEHASALGPSPGRCHLLYRYKLAELQAMVDKAVALFPLATGYISAAQARVRAADKSRVKVRKLGPICELAAAGDDAADGVAPAPALASTSIAKPQKSPPSAQAAKVGVASAGLAPKQPPPAAVAPSVKRKADKAVASEPQAVRKVPTGWPFAVSSEPTVGSNGGAKPEPQVQRLPSANGGKVKDQAVGSNRGNSGNQVVVAATPEPLKSKQGQQPPHLAVAPATPAPQAPASAPPSTLPRLPALLVAPAADHSPVGAAEGAGPLWETAAPHPPGDRTHTAALAAAAAAAMSAPLAREPGAGQVGAATLQGPPVTGGAATTECGGCASHVIAEIDLTVNSDDEVELGCHTMPQSSDPATIISQAHGVAGAAARAAMSAKGLVPVAADCRRVKGAADT